MAIAVAAALGWPPTAAPAQESAGDRPDSAALRLIERARAARGSEAAGLASWEGTVVERVSVDLSTEDLSRERGLYRGDRVARVRWDSAGRETVRWLGIRRRVPVAGSRADVEVDGHEDLATFPLDPVGDRLSLGGSSFVHPLAPGAEGDYRFASGDTTRILLPDAGREIVLVEVRVAPRRSEFDLLAGSMWFDRETAALVRGAFRPARPFDLQLDEPEEAEDVPGFLKPITLTVEVMVVDYALYDLRWWLPTRLRFEGEGRVGSLFRLPLAVESTASDVRVNEPGLDPDFPLPEGWTRTVVHPCAEDAKDRRRGRREDRAAPEPAAPGDSGAAPADTATAPRVCEDGRVRERIVVLPPQGRLDAWWGSAEADSIAEAGPAFDEAELSGLLQRVRDVAVPAPPAPPPGLRVASVRYNRVEGPSAGVAARLPVDGVTTLAAELRVGAADLEPNLTLSVDRRGPDGTLTLSAYRRLAAAADWGDPFTLRSSAHAFLLGYDDGQYYRATGASLAWSGTGPVRGSARLFAEAQRDAPKETDASLPHWISGAELPDNVVSDDIGVVGFEARVRAQAGRDPENIVLAGSAWMEAATGDRSYLRFAGEGSLHAPLFRPLAAAVAIAGGGSAGSLPAQRQWFLGGVETLRAFAGGALRGSAFWLGRLELSTRDPGLRLTGFVDAGWAGDRTDLRLDDPALSAGVGVSALDGLLRLDVARSLRGRDPDAWRVYLSFDGLL